MSEQHYATPVAMSIYMYVRYKNGPRSPIQLTCRRGQVVYNLAEVIINNLERFRIKVLKADDIGPGDVVMHSIDEGGKLTEIHPRTPLKDVQQLTLEFDIDLRQLQIIHSDSSVFVLSRKDETMNDLAIKIGERLGDFHFPDDYLKSLRKKLESEGQLRIYKHPFISGRSTPLDQTKKVAEFERDKFTFSVEAFPKYINSEDVQQEIYGQNIVFFGVPDHGKSSTINSLIMAITSEKGPAQTYPTSSLGTPVYTPYQVTVNGAKFWLSDVPGSCQKIYTSARQDGEELRKKVIRRILDGKLPEREDPIAYKSKLPMLGKGFVKPSAVVIIHKWGAEIDEFDNAVLTEASKTKMGLRTFLIVTHIDEAPNDPIKVNKILKAQADILGIDLINVFTIANVDQEAADFRGMDEDRRKNALFILKEILYAAKIYLNRGESSISQ